MAIADVVLWPFERFADLWFGRAEDIPPYESTTQPLEFVYGITGRRQAIIKLYFSEELVHDAEDDVGRALVMEEAGRAYDRLVEAGSPGIEPGPRG